MVDEGRRGRGEADQGGMRESRMDIEMEGKHGNW